MNLTYVLSTLAQNLLTLCLVVLVSMLVPPPQRPWDGLIQAINRNQLCVFLAVLAHHAHAHAHTHTHMHMRTRTYRILMTLQSTTCDPGQFDGGPGQLLDEDALRQRLGYGQPAEPCAAAQRPRSVMTSFAPPCGHVRLSVQRPSGCSRATCWPCVVLPRSFTPITSQSSSGDYEDPPLAWG